MTDDVQSLRAQDHDELLAVLDESFRREPPSDFRALLPAIYRRADDAQACNRVVRRDGRIVAVVGLFPIAWRVGDQTLRVAGVGGVCVAPAFRGQGLMRLLMDDVMAAIHREGYDLGYLGGHRQRYRYWGWERAGVQAELSISPQCVRHTFGDQPTGVRLAPVHDGAPAPLIAGLQALHDAQPFHCERPASRFSLFLRHWVSRPHAAFAVEDANDDQPIGYVLAHDAYRSFMEVVGRNDATTEAILVQASRELLTEGATVQLDAAPTGLMRRLTPWVESFTLQPSGNWRIWNWPVALGALARARHALSPLAPGRCVLEVTDDDVRFAIDVSDAGVDVSSTRAPADLSLDSTTMLRLLTGPLAPWATAALPPAASVLNAWAPLPLRLSPPDHV